MATSQHPTDLGLTTDFAILTHDSDDECRISGDFYTACWMQMLREPEVHDCDLQHVILNFLTINGFHDTAEEFTKEVDLKPEMPLSSISLRSQIRDAVINGRIEEAIQRIDLIDPRILLWNAEINFLLKQQRLLQLIEKGDTGGAIDFAQQELAPCVKQYPDLLPQLEEAMALLAFSDLKCGEARRLLGGMDQREKTARRIDEAVLYFYNLEQESVLELLAKNMQWSQATLQKRHNTAPRLTSIATGRLSCGGTDWSGARQRRRIDDSIPQHSGTSNQESEEESAAAPFESQG